MYYGGDQAGSFQSIDLTEDSSYVIIGNSSFSPDSNMTSDYGNNDVWVVKTDRYGVIEWQKSYGGRDYDGGAGIHQTKDGGYIFGASTESYNGDVVGNHGDFDSWVVKLDSAGAIQWQKCLGGSAEDAVQDIQLTTDGGCIVFNSTSSQDGDVPSNAGDEKRTWIVKLDSTGNIQWQQIFTGTGEGSIKQTLDNGYILTTTKRELVIVSRWESYYKVYIAVIKLDSSGATSWEKTFGESYGVSSKWIEQTADSGYIVCGIMISDKGDTLGSHGGEDIWVLKLSKTGALQWQKSLGGTAQEWPHYIREVGTKQYVLCGFTKSDDGDVTNFHGYVDAWLVQLDSTGSIQWQKTIGGSSYEDFRAVQPLRDGEYVAVGTTSSTDGDLTGVRDNNSPNAWLVKLSSTVLPVRLVDLSAHLQNNSNILLQWTTANETNTNHFNVQKSTDEIHFANITQLTAAHYSTNELSYSYTDRNITSFNSQTIYYRLGIVDRDNKTVFSEIKVVNLNTSKILLSLLPNPVKNSLQVQITNYSGDAVFNIYTLDGKKVQESRQTVQAGANNAINIVKLPSGVYILTANLKGTLQKKKIYKY